MLATEGSSGRETLNTYRLTRHRLIAAWPRFILRNWQYKSWILSTSIYGCWGTTYWDNPLNSDWSGGARVSRWECWQTCLLRMSTYQCFQMILTRKFMTNWKGWDVLCGIVWIISSRLNRGNHLKTLSSTMCCKVKAQSWTLKRSRNMWQIWRRRKTFWATVRRWRTNTLKL